MNLYIVIFTVIISFVAFNNREVMVKLIFAPYVVKVRKEWFRMLSSGFLHADYLHLGINMYVLYSFGRAVEYYYRLTFDSKGTLYYLLLYFGSIVIANVSTYKKHQDNPAYASLGASGGVSAVVFASIVFNPFGRIYLYGIIGFPGILLGAAYLAYSYYMARKETQDRINHEAHFYGAVFGFVFTILLKPSLLLGFLQEFANFFR